MIGIYIVGGGGDSGNAAHVDVSDDQEVRNLSLALSEEEGMYSLDLLRAVRGVDLRGISMKEASAIAARIRAEDIPEENCEWDEYSEDEIRSWHAGVHLLR